MRQRHVFARLLVFLMVLAAASAAFFQPQAESRNSNEIG